MNDDDVITGGSVEGRRSHELQRDDDVLSLDLQRELEALGSGIGVVAVVALVASQLTRARRLVTRTPFARAEAPRG